MFMSKARAIGSPAQNFGEFTEFDTLTH